LELGKFDPIFFPGAFKATSCAPSDDMDMVAKADDPEE
jgi:hypothetical protein